MNVVTTPRPRKVCSVLNKNISFSKENNDVESTETIKTENGTQTKFGKGKVKLMDWKKYHRLNVIYAFIEELERDYPAICTVSVIGKSVEGRDIKMLKISNSNASNTAVWLDASIHPREWITTAVVTYIADMIVKNFQNLSNSMTNKDWHIVPVLNPDGYEYTHTHDRMWRKNRACYDGEFGVDLNRNFSYGWGNNGDEGSSEEPNNVFYRGPAPFSEPESTAVRTIMETTGLTYRVGSTKDLTYYACGTSIDWSYAIAKIPYSYMIELRSRRHRFKLPKDQIMDNCIEIWNAINSLMDYVDNQKSI
ncbi:unnamed protein product [Diatraea saccharalis]|uniref:Peptidase M14 domain-containing protein n=1 Tax=Diatraea saccharalis TaxID=40085 RepID=A0A9N9WFJ1_9NEOP|nr:unnamed protein product [Diatraea saccharalis]